MKGAHNTTASVMYLVKLRITQNNLAANDAEN